MSTHPATVTDSLAGLGDFIASVGLLLLPVAGLSLAIAVVGWLLGALEVVQTFWAVPVGVAIGALIMLALMQLQWLRRRSERG